jgi:hypothetical protein
LDGDIARPFLAYKKVSILNGGIARPFLACDEGVKTHYMGAKNVVTLYCFLGVSMFELQPW